jgi:hypothetical protein
MEDIIALGQPTVGEPELAAIAEVFRSGWLSGAGPRCVKFQKRFAAAVGTQHALATSNCGSALHLALLVRSWSPSTMPPTGVRWPLSCAVVAYSARSRRTRRSCSRCTVRPTPAPFRPTSRPT